MKHCSVLSIVFLFWCTACGLVKMDNEAEPKSYSLDGVKLIRPEIRDGGDPSTMQQLEYSISDSSRLLLRFESFLSKVDSISLAKGRKVYIDISLLPDADAGQAKNDLVLCPMTVNWMMLATWYQAYPMGRSGTWKTQGGDFALAECVAVTTETSGLLQFDVTTTVANHAVGRGQNYGFALTSKTAAAYGIYGDLHGTKSPRIEWTGY